MSFTQELLFPASDMLQNSLKIPLPWANQTQEPSGLCRQSYVSIYISHFCSPQACDFPRVGFPELAPDSPHLLCCCGSSSLVSPSSSWEHQAKLSFWALWGGAGQEPADQGTGSTKQRLCPPSPQALGQAWHPQPQMRQLGKSLAALPAQSRSPMSMGPGVRTQVPGPALPSTSYAAGVLWWQNHEVSVQGVTSWLPGCRAR